MSFGSLKESLQVPLDSEMVVVSMFPVNEWRHVSESAHAYTRRQNDSMI